MSDDLDWHVIFAGSGSVTGNDWLEEVCYVGQERWLLRVRDDPAWSFDPIEEELEHEEKSSAELVEWVRSIDTAGMEATLERRRNLHDVAVAVGAGQCAALLQVVLAQH